MSNKAIYGLVLAGGRSKRMKTDKASLIFHAGKRQSVYCYELLKYFCDQVFLSIREDQVEHDGIKGYPHIFDAPEYKDAGPMGGILSAMKQYPQADWLVLAVDLPYINEKAIEHLFAQRDTAKQATAFVSVHDGKPEPLCAIYESGSHEAMKIFFDEGKNCPRKFLINHDVALLEQEDKKWMDNINKPEEYEKAQEDLGKA